MIINTVLAAKANHAVMVEFAKQIEELNLATGEFLEGYVGFANGIGARKTAENIGAAIKLSNIIDNLISTIRQHQDTQTVNLDNLLDKGEMTS